MALALAAAAAAVVSPGLAHANAAAAEFNLPDAAAGARLASATSLAVEHEDLVIRCDGDRGESIGCSFEATYHLHNPTTGDREALGAFYGGWNVDIALDGKNARAEVPPELLRALDAAAGQPIVRRTRAPNLPASFELGDGRPRDRTGFKVSLPAGARARLVFAGRIGPIHRENPSVYGGFAIQPHTTRHIKLATPEDRETHTRFRYFLAPLRTWAGARTIDIEISAPERWPLGAPPLAGGEGPWRFTHAGGRTVARTRAHGESAGDLDFEINVPGHAIFNGGPFAAAGGTFGAGGGLRLRAGYDVARPVWLIYSLALETNARDRLAAAAVVEAALPSFLFVFPSLSLGAGPIAERHRGATSPGLRVQAAASVILFSMVLAADTYPGRSGDDGIHWSLFGQLSL